MLKAFLYRFYFIFLDTISIPGIFINSEENAKYHLRVVCPLCPNCRRKFRYVGENKCWWEEQWKAENYLIPRHFGVKNFLKQYLGIKTDLRKFRK
jgi:hypothetical protein